MSGDEDSIGYNMGSIKRETSMNKYRAKKVISDFKKPKDISISQKLTHGKETIEIEVKRTKSNDYFKPMRKITFELDPDEYKDDTELEIALIEITDMMFDKNDEEWEQIKKLHNMPKLPEFLKDKK